MAYQGYDLRLTRYGTEGWRATFYNGGREHSIWKGTSWEPTAWQTVQVAAWQVLATEAGIPAVKAS